MRRTQMHYIGHTFWEMALGITFQLMLLGWNFSVSVHVFMVKESDNIIYMIYDLDLSRSWPFWNGIFGHISVTSAKI